jgi:hypothetical protein
MEGQPSDEAGSRLVSGILLTPAQLHHDNPVGRVRGRTSLEVTFR